MTGGTMGIEDDPRYRDLVRLRSRWAWTLTVLVVALYTAFILLVALGKPLLARPIAGSISLGIPIGFAMIVTAVGSIALFSALANRVFDPRLAVLLDEYRA